MPLIIFLMPLSRADPNSILQALSTKIPPKTITITLFLVFHLMERFNMLRLVFLVTVCDCVGVNEVKSHTATSIK